MDFEAVHGAIDSAGEFAYQAITEILNNEALRETVTTLCDFLHANYELVFGFTATFQFLSAPMLFTTGVTVGYWFYDKEITIMPGNIKWAAISLFESSTAKLVSLAIALFLRFVLDATLSYMAVGFLAGCAVNRLLLHAIAAASAAMPRGREPVERKS